MRPPFRALLVANRGEIAVRVIHACRALGVRAVAVYSEVDRDALHVRLADEALPIGPAPARESYLNVERLVEAARRAGAEAVHPGYGFLAESPDLAAACAAAGLVFVGPSPEAIRLMGDKAAAKARMAAAGVPVLPGYHGAAQEDDVLLAAAERLGYPLLAKAAAGGGGRGMRRVDSPAELPAALAAARREAAAAFGDDRLLLERLLERARHVEIQVLADHHRRTLHLGERECSLQRRRQKIVEEAPSPAVDPDLRARMGAAAVRAAATVGYAGAGTVEFLLAPGGAFYFLEMNTRIQVEHPVTELVWGIDLVAWQIRVAAGEPLPWRQEDLAPRGHAIEARIYAEDPRSGLPAAGTVRRLVPPLQPGLRHDLGVAEGETVGLHYDPLLAKLIAHGADRGEALRRLRLGLAAYQIVGPPTNLPLLRALLGSSEVEAGELDVEFVDRHAEALRAALAPGAPPPGAVVAAALQDLLGAGLTGQAAHPRLPWAGLGAWRATGGEAILRYAHPGGVVEVRAERLSSSRPPASLRLAVEGTMVLVEDALAERGGAVRWREGSRVRSALVNELAGGQGEVEVVVEGGAHRLRRWVPAVPPASSAGEDPPARAEAVPSARPRNGAIGAPIPGRVLALLAKEGERVEAGQPVLTLEAMKIEQPVLAPRAGTIRRVLCREGDLVQAGATLVELDEP